MAAKNGRTTIKIDPEVLSNAKRDAELAGLTLSAFIERALRRRRSQSEAPSQKIDLPSFDLGESLVDLSPTGIKELFAQEEIDRLRRIEVEATKRQEQG